MSWPPSTSMPVWLGRGEHCVDEGALPLAEISAIPVNQASCASDFSFRRRRVQKGSIYRTTRRHTIELGSPFMCTR